MSPEGRAIVGDALPSDEWICKLLSDLVRVQLGKEVQYCFNEISQYVKAGEE